jgi:tRNA threonylcarbamoyladenosine biosynthesis protein TsaE
VNPGALPNVVHRGEKPRATMAGFLSHRPAQTEALGEAWGREAAPDWVIALTGDLGAGKTQLVKGLARGLGSAARVHSPTFTLVNEYLDGRLPLYHLDLYRLETPAQIASAGLEEFLRPNGVTVIEWAERMPELGTRNSERGRLRRVTIEVLSETERRITYDDVGA